MYTPVNMVLVSNSCVNMYHVCFYMLFYFCNEISLQKIRWYFNINLVCKSDIEIVIEAHWGSICY